MANRLKEEEKNEKIIRGLLKLPANKRCINCNNLGPQYVCTNFWTFICTNCSGVHREFTHRVKSVSMAKFTSQEVAALQGGGNERAREIFFKDWDPQRNQFPDSSNIDKLRDFIKHVYEEKRFSGDRRVPKPKADSEAASESRRPDSYRGGSRSPPYNGRYNESPGYNSRNTPNERSPGYSSYSERSPGDYRRSPQQRVDDRRAPEGTKPQGGSPNYQGDAGSLPPVKPVRDILGADAPPLRIGELPKPNGTKVVVNPLPPPQVERTSSASSIGSGPGESTSVQPSTQPTVQPAVQPKKEEPPAIVSLIDFSTDLEAPISSPPAPQPQVQQLHAQNQTGLPQQINSPPANTNSSDWSAFDAFGAQKAVPPVATNVNHLDSALSQLSLSGSPVTQSTQPSLFNAPSLVGVSGNQHQFGASVVPPNQPPSLFQPSIPANGAQPPQENPAPIENKPSARTALPEDFFTSLYPPAAAPMPGWPRGPQYGMGYGMQYPAPMVMPSYPQPQPQPMQSVNPFDIGNEPAAAQASNFPLMGPGPMQGAPQNMNMPPQQHLMRSTSSGSTSPRWMPQQQMSYASAAPPSQYMMQQVPGAIPQQMPSNMMQMMQQGALGQVNTGAAPFGASMSDPSLAGRYSQPSTPNSSFGTVGGNPFG